MGQSADMASVASPGTTPDVHHPFGGFRDSDPPSRSRAPPGSASTPGSRRPRSGTHGDRPAPSASSGRASSGWPWPGNWRRRSVPVVVFEKETAVAQHQSGHNSGVVHAGIYYLPGSAKATLCRRGVELLSAYCADRGLPWDARGKLVVARDDAESGEAAGDRAAGGRQRRPRRAVAGRGGHPGAGAGDHRRRPRCCRRPPPSSTTPRSPAPSPATSRPTAGRC